MNQAQPASTYPSVLNHRAEGLFNFRRFRKSLFAPAVSKFSLLSSPRIDCPDKSISSLQVHPIDSRYLLTGCKEGNISVYDLSRFGSELQSGAFADEQAVFRHKPVARSTSRHNIIKTQWYPTDSGAFVSISTDGVFSIWDTNEMIAVSQIRPFQHENLGEITALPSCMDLSRAGNMAAMGSRHVVHIKLVDIRTAASGHSLTGHSRGVSAVQWCPTNEFILATGSYDCSIRLWDIRKAGSRSCITILDRDLTVLDETVATSFSPHFSHLRFTSSSKRKRKALRGSDNFCVAESKVNVAHEEYITGLSFLRSGHRIVSAGAEGSLQVWDLRNRGQRLLLRFQSPGGGLAIDRHTSSHRVTPLWLSDDETVWVPKGNVLYAFNLLEGGKPFHTLNGHLMPVLSVTGIPSSGRLLSGGSDGLILCWGSGKKPNTDEDVADEDGW